MRTLGILVLSMLLAACQTNPNPKANTPLCKELRAKMMFNGSAVDPNKKFLANSDQPKLQESYHDEDCI